MSRRASAYGCAARAYACTGRYQDAATNHDKAIEGADTLDPRERKVFDEFYCTLNGGRQ